MRLARRRSRHTLLRTSRRVLSRISSYDLGLPSRVSQLLLLRRSLRRSLRVPLSVFGWVLITLSGCSDAQKVQHRDGLTSARRSTESAELSTHQRELHARARLSGHRVKHQSDEFDVRLLKRFTPSELVSISGDLPSGVTLRRLAARAHAERWGRAHTLRLGPIPDYAPLTRVYAHQQLRSLAPESHHLLTRRFVSLGLRSLLEIEDYDPGEADLDGSLIEDTMLIWVRDYHPIYARLKSGELVAAQYLAHNPNRARYAIKQDLSAIPSEPELIKLSATADRETRRALARIIAPQRLFDRQVDLPLIHENGNLIVAGPWIFMSERIIDDNRGLESDLHLIDGGYLPRGPNGIKHELSARLGIPRSRVVILPPLPHEATNHVDLYLMALNDHQVIIPQIEHAAINALNDDQEMLAALDVLAFLDERARQLARLGLEVIRLPMLPPLSLPALDEPDGVFDVVFYSPTNGLLINTGRDAHVMLPHLNPELILRPKLKALNTRYESIWVEVFSKLGWRPTLIETTTLGRYLGLIHCVTAATPKLPLRSEWLTLKRRQRSERRIDLR